MASVEEVSRRLEALIEWSFSECLASAEALLRAARLKCVGCCGADDAVKWMAGEALKGLLRAAHLATLLKDRDRARRVRELAEEVLKAIEERGLSEEASRLKLLISTLEELGT